MDGGRGGEPRPRRSANTMGGSGHQRTKGRLCLDGHAQNSLRGQADSKDVSGTWNWPDRSTKLLIVRARMEATEYEFLLGRRPRFGARPPLATGAGQFRPTSRRRWAGAALAFAVALLGYAPHEARSDGPYSICVSSSGIIDLPCPGGCTEIVPTIALALSTASALPADSDGSRPEVHVCLTSFDPHVESVVVDNSGHQIGDLLWFEATALLQCPDPLTDAGTPTLDWITSNSGDPARRDTIIGWQIGGVDGTACSGVLRPGLRVQGPGSLAFSGSISDTVDYAIEAGPTGQAADLWLTDSSLRRGTGAALRTSGWALVERTQFGAFEVDGGVDGALVYGTAPAAYVNIHASLFHSNRLLVGPGGGAMIEVPTLDIQDSLVVENAIVGVGGLVASRFHGVGWDLELGNLGPTYFGIDRNVFARNRWYVVGESARVGTWPLLSLSGPLSTGCAGIDSSWPTESLQSPRGGTSAGSEGYLLGYAGSSVAGGTSAALVTRNFFIDNSFDDGFLITLDADVGGLLAQVIHNSVRTSQSVSMMDIDAARPDGSVFVARNLWVQGLSPGPAQTALVLASGQPGGLFVSGNVTTGVVPWTSAIKPGAFSILGPNHLGAQPAFVAATTIRGAWDPCSRFEYQCPSSPASDCSSWPGGELPCLPDAAAELVPTADWVAAFGDPWPWESDFFIGPEPGWESPGATGWVCDAPRPTADAVTAGPASWGDGDGFPDALDCDNEDPSVTPSLPSPDGVPGPYCDEIEDDCYQCPEGSAQPPDDDSAADDDSSDPDPPSGNDDSATPPGEKPDPGGPPDEGPGEDVLGTESCESRGCGYSWSAFPLAIAVLGGRRRRARQWRPTGAGPLSVVAADSHAGADGHRGSARLIRPPFGPPASEVFTGRRRSSARRMG